MSSVPQIGVSMTTGMSLEHWSRVGFLDRELSIYGNIADAIGGRIVFISYGGPEESDFLGGDPRFDVIPKAIPKVSNLAYSLLAGSALRDQMNRLWLLKSNQMRGSWVALAPQRRLKLPFLLRCGMEWLEGLELSNQNTKLYRAAVARAEHYMYHRADAIMLPNPTSVRFVQDRFQIQAEKIHLFMNSIDCDAFTPEDPDKRIPKRIVFVGRIYPTKRIELLLRAAATIPDAEVILVGKEPAGLDPEKPSYKQELEKLAHELSVHVEFTGSVPNQELPRILSEANVFVLPSMIEGSPKALMEAMAKGCPCVGTRAPGIQEILHNEENGLLVEGEVADLSKAIRRLIDDRELAKKLGAAAANYAREHFNLKRNIEREAALLKSMMRDPAKAR